MKSFEMYNSINGNINAKLETWIDDRANEGLEQFKKRIKSWKSYNEEMILDEIYNYIKYISSLKKIIKSNNQINFKLWKNNNNLINENKKLKKENEEFKDLIIDKFKGGKLNEYKSKSI